MKDHGGTRGASIGQVHRDVLRDGREVAVKIQYPKADRMVEADLKNLKVLLGNLVSLVTDIDFEPIWEEVKARLFEKLDYRKEADSIQRMAAMHANTPEIIVPDVVQEATTRRVLTMGFVDGIPPGEAVSGRYPQDLKDEWGITLFEFTLRGVFEHRFLIRRKAEVACQIKHACQGGQRVQSISAALSF